MHLLGTMMKHNINIPGWNSQEILNILGTYASDVPDDGNILELGALFGRTTYTLGHNKRSSVRLYTIDIWPTINLDNHRDVWIHDRTIGVDEANLLQSSFVNKDGIDYLPGDIFRDLWDGFTVGIENKIGIRGNTNMPTVDFPMFDFIFHDASHEYEIVYGDLNHWYPKLLPGGVMIIDDYEVMQFPGVVKAVDQFAAEHNLFKEMVTDRNILLKGAL